MRDTQILCRRIYGSYVKRGCLIIGKYMFNTTIYKLITIYSKTCLTNNIINFKKTNKNLHNYCRLIEKKYNDKKYIDITLTFDEWFHNKENTDYPTFENQTMRMTVYENK